MSNRVIIISLLIAVVLGYAVQPAAAQANNFYVGGTGASDSNNCRAQYVSGGGNGPCEHIAYATQLALQTDAHGNMQVINLAGNMTFNETVSVSGAPFKGSFEGIHNGILYQGNGTTTIWNNSSDACGTLIVNQGGNVAIRNLDIRATNSTCASALYAQNGGQIVVYDGLYFGGGE
jgi:pectate lyase